ncbi:hypothetical protein F5141DRAFT_1213765 [Pisolithus sp. B1]|nr:hypothetical protein F5141DRAFT_1213765 [Pisolithus sp. B1]
MPDYDDNMQTMIGNAFEALMALQARFPQCAAQPKVKLAMASSSGPQVGGEVVRQSQRQLEKTTDKGREGEMGTEGGSPAKHIEAAVLSGMGDTMVDNNVTEVKPTSSSADPCEWCMKQGIICVWKEWTACEACHDGKKKCDKAGRLSRKHKNPKGLPPELALSSKKAKVNPMPLSSSAPVPTTGRSRSWLVSHSTASQPALELHTALMSVPQCPWPPQPVPQFLPSSGLTTPTPTSGLPVPLSSHVEEKPADDMAESSKGSSEFLSAQIDSCRDEEASKVERGKGRETLKIEIDLTETEEILTPKEATQASVKGKHKVWCSWMHLIKELDVRITKIEQLVEWGEDALLNLYVQMAQQSKCQLQALKAWQQEHFVMAPLDNP